MSEIIAPDPARAGFARAMVRLYFSFFPWRPMLWTIGLASLAAGLAWQWNWLAAIGVAPLLISAAPCAAMCALGVCMSRVRGGACHGDSAAPADRTDGNATVAPQRNEALN
jgi:hypothetical protein